MTRPPFARRGRRAPFSQVGDWVAVADIEAPAKTAYWALEAMTFRDTSEEGAEVVREADPSRETLAELLGYSRPQSVDRYLTQLLDIGAIDVVPNPGYPNSYVVHQTPPDGYEGPRTMGEWHKRRAARKAAERAAREAAEQGKSGADPASSQVEARCAPQRTSPDRTYALQRTGGVRSSAQQVCAPAHTKEEPLVDAPKKPLTPAAQPAVGRSRTRSAGKGSAPASGAPATSLCEHGQSACRACGTNPRARAREATVAELTERERLGRSCGMCVADGLASDGGTSWVRVDPATRARLAPRTVCDHSTPHARVVRQLAMEEAAAEEERRRRKPVDPRAVTGARLDSRSALAAVGAPPLPERKRLTRPVRVPRGLTGREEQRPA